jgi:23S rRNA pseudouridine2605 synthase
MLTIGLALARRNDYTSGMAIKPLLKALAEAGIASRRWLADAIKQGRVKVNGEIAEDFRQPVDVESDRISISGQPVDLKPRQLVYIMLNKPKGIMSTTSDERGRRTVISILPQKYRHLRLYPVGRLDKNTTGLLLLTNDGELTNQLTHPRFEREKEYLVSTSGKLQPDEKRKLEQGIELEDGLTHPAVVKEVETPPFNYSITIREGKKRQVHRMFESLGHPILELKRTRIGRFKLGNLPQGAIREISEREVKALLR